jgi:hypothetical protein
MIFSLNPLITVVKQCQELVIAMSWMKTLDRVLRATSDANIRFDELRRVLKYLVIDEWMETAKELGRPIPKPRGRLLFA